MNGRYVSVYTDMSAKYEYLLHWYRTDANFIITYQTKSSNQEINESNLIITFEKQVLEALKIAIG